MSDRKRRGNDASEVEPTIESAGQINTINGFMGVFSAVGSKTLLDYLKSQEGRDQIQDQLEQHVERFILGNDYKVKSKNTDVISPKHVDGSKQVPGRRSEQYEDLAETDDEGYEEYRSTIYESSVNPDAITKTPLYNFIWKNVEWQRDNYFIGQAHADRRKRERASDTFYSKLLGSRVLFSRIPNTDTNAWGLIHLTSLAPAFIPSATVYNSVLPLVSALPYGVLREPAYEATASLIPASQKTLDEVVKFSLVQVFHNEQFKELVRSSFRYQAEGYLFKNIPTDSGQSE